MSNKQRLVDFLNFLYEREPDAVENFAFTEEDLREVLTEADPKVRTTEASFWYQGKIEGFTSLLKLGASSDAMPYIVPFDCILDRGDIAWDHFNHPVIFHLFKEGEEAPVFSIPGLYENGQSRLEQYNIELTEGEKIFVKADLLEVNPLTGEAIEIEGEVINDNPLIKMFLKEK